MSTSSRRAGPSCPGRGVVELEIWTGCRELIVEGSIDPRTIGGFEDCLRRTVESDHDLVLIDLDRCDFLDVAAVNLLEQVGAFECEPALATPGDPARRHEI